MQIADKNRDSAFTCYGKLKHLLGELANYQTVADFCCEGRSCPCMTDTKRYNNDEKLNQLILRSDDSMFNTVTSQTLNMDPLSIINNAYVIARNSNPHAEAVAFAT